MSSILWLKGDTYYYSTEPTIGESPNGIEMKCLGNWFNIVNFLQSYCFSQSFSQLEIRKNPAKWAAYFVFLGRGTLSLSKGKIEFDSSELVLMDILESVNTSTWINNPEIVQKLCVSLIRHSMNLK